MSNESQSLYRGKEVPRTKPKSAEQMYDNELNTKDVNQKGRIITLTHTKRKTHTRITTYTKRTVTLVSALR